MVMVIEKDISKSKDLQFNLLDNALDFLLSAAEAAQRDNDSRSLKDAVLHLANGVEVLVKSRLAREHWSLIFFNIEKASYEELDKADFRSVDFSIARGRLERIAQVKIGELANSHIDGLRKLRNRLTHFTATLDSLQAKSLIAKTMTFCVEFCEEQKMTSSGSGEKLGEIHMNLAEFKEFVDERMKSINAELAYALIWECPECWQDTLAIEEGEAECKFCRIKQNPQELARIEGRRPPEDCPECGEESTFAITYDIDNSVGWTCFACGINGEEYDYCEICSKVDYFSQKSDSNICEHCRDTCSTTNSVAFLP